MDKMDKTVRDQIIEEDFGFLKDIEIHEVDGKPMLGDGNIPFNVQSVIYEKDFVREWLMAFAVGNEIGVNYFNLQKWFSISLNGTKAVMVVDENRQPLFVVPPLISHNLTPREMDFFRTASEMMYANSNNVQISKDPQANLRISNQVVEKIKDVKRRTFTDLITPAFYEKYSIVPLVEQQIYYIKDRINDGKTPIEEINALRLALYKNHKGEKLTSEEKELVARLSKNSFELNEPSDTKENENNKQAQGTGNNPFEC